MTDTVTAAGSKAPMSFWIVSGISLLWNMFGGYDYIMTRTRNIEYLKNAGDPQVILGWIDSFPFWAQVLWAVGVWGSLLGSVLLLLRSRHAASAFLLSLLGAIGSFGYQFASETPAALDTTANKAMPIVILVIVVALWRFSKRAVHKGFLR